MLVDDEPVGLSMPLLEVRLVATALGADRGR